MAREYRKTEKACACIMRGQHGAASWRLRFVRAWRYACAVQDAESAVRA